MPVSRSYTLTRFLSLLRPYRRRAMFIALTSVATMLGWLGLPLLLRTMIASSLAGISAGFNLPNLLQLAGVLVILTLATYATVYLSFDTGARIASDIRARYLEHVIQAPITFHREWKSGDIIERLVASVTEVERFVGSSLMIVFGGVVLLFGCAGMMLNLSWKLTLLLLISMPLLSVGSRGMTAASRRAMKKSSESASAVTSLFHEILHGIEIVKSFNARVFEHGRLAALQADLLSKQRQLALRNALVEPVSLSTIVGLVLLLVLYGNWEMSQKRLSPEDFITFLFYTSFLIPQARAISVLTLGWQQFQNAQGRLEEIFAVPSEQDPPGAVQFPRRPDGSVEFRDVWFAYRDREPVLRCLNLRVLPGECVGVVGVSGAGKTTLFNLLLRFYRVEQGAILLDGYDVNALALRSLRDSIAVVPQDIILFDGSVKENVRYGRPGAMDADVYAVCAAAQMDEFIRSLPAGYDTRVGERGVQLSVGQRQRLAIARALLKDAPILLLDEATSSLDGHTERNLRDAIDLAAKGRTTIIIAHRLSTVMHLQRLIVLHEGKILDEGSHDVLLQRCGFYRMLVSTQLIRAEAGTLGDLTGETAGSDNLKTEKEYEDAPRPGDSDTRGGGLLL